MTDINGLHQVWQNIFLAKGWVVKGSQNNGFRLHPSPTPIRQVQAPPPVSLLYLCTATDGLSDCLVKHLTTGRVLVGDCETLWQHWHDGLASSRRLHAESV